MEQAKEALEVLGFRKGKFVKSFRLAVRRKSGEECESWRANENISCGSEGIRKRGKWRTAKEVSVKATPCRPFVPRRSCLRKRSRR